VADCGPRSGPVAAHSGRGGFLADEVEPCVPDFPRLDRFAAALRPRGDQRDIEPPTLSRCKSCGCCWKLSRASPSKPQTRAFLICRISAVVAQVRTGKESSQDGFVLFCGLDGLSPNATKERVWRTCATVTSPARGGDSCFAAASEDVARPRKER
jgi:hypothetical protein